MSSRRALKRYKDLEHRHGPEHGDSGHGSNWAISYGDMITLLLAFFVLFFSVDRNKASKEITQLSQALKDEFKGADPSSTTEKKLADTFVWGFPSTQKGVYFGVNPKDFDIKTTTEGDKLIVEFPNISFFESASFKLTQDGTAALSVFANIFKDFTGALRLVVRGYTDNRPVKANNYSRFKDNLELSAFRAISALRVLQEYGVPFRYMRIGGYGETDKAKKTSAQNDLQWDRKIVIVIEPLDQTERGLEEVFPRVPSSENGESQ